MKKKIYVFKLETYYFSLKYYFFFYYSKIEDYFLAGKLRLNGEKLLKKSKQVGFCCIALLCFDVVFT